MSNKIIKTEFNDIGRAFSDTTILMHEAIARKAGLSGSDHKYLGLLIQQGSMTAGDLAKLTGFTTGSITGLIDRLEKKKLAKREFDKTDRRKIIIVPNIPNAMKLLGGIFGEVSTKMTALTDTLNDKEKKIIEKYMKSCIEIMQEITQKLNNKEL